MADSIQSSASLDDSSAVELSGKIMVAAIIVLFFVIVFVLFLHLYAKWFWWRTAADDATTRRRARRSRFVFAPGQDPGLPALRRGLDPSLLASIPVLLFRPQDFKDGLECAVCLSELAPGEKARLLPKCNHGFHVECIDMWFQSHSTCPLCRNPVGTQLSEDPSSSPDSFRLSVSEETPAGDYSTESPNFPTNVLFWGNQTQVTSGGLNLEEEEEEGGAASSQSQPQPQPQPQSPYGMLVIDIPRQTAEIFPSVSPSTAGSSEEEVEMKSPMARRLRSFKRLLSREKRVVPRSPGSLDVEQLGKGQTSKSNVDV